MKNSYNIDFLTICRGVLFRAGCVLRFSFNFCLFFRKAQWALKTAEDFFGDPFSKYTRAENISNSIRWVKTGKSFFLGRFL
jgi:hypothetical protein